MTWAPKVLPAALLALSLAACSGGGETATTITAPEPSETQAMEPVELTVGLTYIPNIQFAPFYVAAELGYFSDEGLAVTLRHHGASESLFGALASGEEDVVNAGADEMLQAYAADVPVVTTGVMYQEYPVVLIVPEDSPIESLADMEGQSIGLPGPYGENWFWLLAAIDEAGLAEEDVAIEFIGYTQQAALMGGTVDGVVGFANNDVLNFGRSGVEVRSLTADVPLVGISVGALEETVETRGEDLAALNRALARAMEFILADPAAAVDASFDYIPELTGAGAYEATLETLEATMALYGDTPLAVEAELWPSMYEFMVSRGLAEPGTDPSRAVTTALVP